MVLHCAQKFKSEVAQQKQKMEVTSKHPSTTRTVISTSHTKRQTPFHANGEIKFVWRCFPYMQKSSVYVWYRTTNNTLKQVLKTCSSLREMVRAKKVNKGE